MNELLERDAVLAQLHAALERVRASGTGEVAIVSGAAGVGKTSLMRAFVAGQPGGDVLWGACDGLRTPRPLGPLLDMAATADADLARVAADVAAAAAPRDALFQGTVERLLTPPRPMIVVIEDAHWADDATLDFLTFLGRRASSTRALFVITYRDDEVGARHPLRVALGDIAASIRERVHLQPLSADGVATLAAGHDVDAAALHDITGGNPFYVTESLAAGTGGVPDSVRDAVLARAGRLHAEARRLVDAIAIVPGRVELWLVDAIAGPDADALDECVEGGLVDVSNGFVALRHELARLAVVDAMPPARRRGLHRRALDALHERATRSAGVSSARLAHHALEAGDLDAVLAHTPDAADEAQRRGAHREAAAHLREAVRHADRLPSERRGRLHVLLANQLTLLNQPEEAIEAFRVGIAHLHDAGDRREEGRALVRLASAFTTAARAPESTEVAHRALEVLEPLGPSADLADAYVSIASVHMLARQLGEAIDWSYRGERMADEVGDEETTCVARIQGGVAELMAGVDGGLGRIRSGIELAREHQWDDRVALGYSQIGSGAGEIRRYDVAVPALQECVRFSSDHELLANLAYAYSWLGRCALEQGRWDDAGQLASELLANPRTVGIARLTALITIGRLRARRGDPEVWAALDDALALARQTGHLQRLWPAAVARVEAAWLEGRIEDEADLVDEVFLMAERLGYPWAVGELAFWRSRTGRVAEAPPAAPEPFRHHIAGRFEEAAATWAAIGCPYEQADALGESTSIDSVRAALDAFDRLGAHPAAARTTARLRAMGVRVARGPNRAAKTNPANLTDRELDVLALLVDGCSNRELGERLGISTKTAGHHVSSILAKLAVANRAEAAVAAVRMGIASSEM